MLRAAGETLSIILIPSTICANLYNVMLRFLANRKELSATLLVLAVVILSYFNALSNGFVYDDVPLVEINPWIEDWHYVPTIFTTGYWSSTGSDAGGLYRPLTIFSYLVEHVIGGHGPLLFHLDNILLHFLCCVLVYFILRRLTSSEAASVIAALIFAVHPVHVEAVANISGRSELLASLFVLTGFYSFIVRPRYAPWYIISPALLFLGLLSKESAVVLPLLVFVYLLLFERDGRGKDLRSIVVSLAPYALVTAAFLVIRIIVIAEEVYPQGTAQVLVYTKGYYRMLVMFKVFLSYMRLSVFPTDLNAHYMLRPPDSLLDVYVLLFLGIVGTFVAFSPRLIKSRPVYFFFGIWFFIALLPVSNIIPIGILMSERSMYLPSVSVCAIAGLLFSGAVSSLSSHSRLKTLALAAVLVLFASFATLTHVRNRVWHDSDSIDEDLIRSYTRIINNFPESGLYYVHMSKALRGLKRNDEALACLKKALELEPDVFANYVELADLYSHMDEYENALPVVNYALALSAAKEPTIYADTYAMFAEVYYKNGKFDEAKTLIDKALSMGPQNMYMTNAKMDTHLYNMDMFEESERYLKLAIEFAPYDGDYHADYARLLLNMGKEEEALEELRKAESLEELPAKVYFDQGILYAKREKYLPAVEYLEKAAERDPENPEIRYYLAAACIGAGRYDQAERELKTALRLKPDYKEAQWLLDQKK